MAEEKTKTIVAEVMNADFMSIAGTRYGDVRIEAENEDLDGNGIVDPETELYVTGAYDHFIFPICDDMLTSEN